jgi:hypothetical protein
MGTGWPVFTDRARRVASGNLDRMIDELIRAAGLRFTTFQTEYASGPRLSTLAARKRNRHRVLRKCAYLPANCGPSTASSAFSTFGSSPR